MYRRLYRAGTTRFKDSRWFKLLPAISAAVLIVVGVWLCKAAVSAAFAG